MHSVSLTIDANKIMEQLKTQADLALFRAKAAGRNRCVKYADILVKFGKVLQHHRETDVVVIDLGRQTKVSLGQEFYVFHPEFSGLEPFVFRDGRTERKLGVYPKMPSGRIEVFDVQSEISFAYIQERRGMDVFPPGCLLEAIPIGSIGHLIKEEWWRGDKGDMLKVGQEIVKQQLQRMESAGSDVMVYVVGLGNEADLAGSRGVGFVNRALAAMYTRLRSELVDVEVVAQVANDRFAIVSGECQEGLQTQVLAAIQGVTEELEGIPRFVVGVYLHSEVRALRTDASEYSISNALDYALFSLGGGGVEQGGVFRFSRSTPQNVLLNARRQGAYDQVEKDYQTLRSLGIRNANVENQRGLALFESGAREEAVRAGESALDLSPDDRTLQMNLALFSFAAGDRGRAGMLFAQMNKPDELKSRAYVIARAMGLYELFKSDKQAVDRSELMGLLERAREGPPDRRLNVTRSEIVLAFIDVRGSEGSA